MRNCACESLHECVCCLALLLSGNISVCVAILLCDGVKAFFTRVKLEESEEL